MQLRPLQPSDLPRLSHLLQQVFEVPPGTRFTAEDMLAWKYFWQAPSWGKDLSFVMERDDKLVAHIGICPVRFMNVSGETLSCVASIDWAADKGTLGAGVIAYKHMMKQAPVAFLIGGTATTWEFSRRLGFKTALEARLYTRWLRPVKEFVLREKSPRAVARLLHAVVHPPFGPTANRTGWSITRVPAFDDQIQPVLASGQRSFTTALRTIDELNHRLACPGARTQGYILHKAGAVHGYAVAAIGNWEAKIVDAGLREHTHDDWSAAYSLITDALRQEKSICRIEVLSAVPMLQRALESNGYWINRREPLCFYDPGNLLNPFLPLDIQFFESDLAYHPS
jgi:hypothetical protein